MSKFNKQLSEQDYDLELEKVNRSIKENDIKKAMVARYFKYEEIGDVLADYKKALEQKQAKKNV